jgi:hypothetical protein
MALSLVLAMPLHAQTPPPPTDAAAPQDEAAGFSTEQLDALLAPIALYPDALLTQILMAATEPLQIVQAKRWLGDPAHAALKGDALIQALAPESWDPSVKSLVPFPQVLDMLNANLDWTQQLGYAFATQQADVLDSVQRLRRQAQAAGHLQSTPQQTVTTEAEALVIQPVDPQVVFLPTYNPTVVFGSWPYPAVPPVVLPPPPGYAIGSALATGLAFGAGIAVTAALWNLARPNWGWRGPGYGGVNVNVNRWNNVNVNRPPLHGSNWRPPPSGRPGGWTAGRPPAGPVGRPGRPHGVPPNAIGRPSVNVPGNLVNRPARPPGSPPPLQRPGGNGGNRPGGNGPGQRPGGGNGPNLPQRPGGGGNAPQRPGNGGNLPQRPGGGAGGGAQRPGGGQLPQRPGGGGAAPQRPPSDRPAINRPAAPPRGNGGGAFAGMNEGRQAGQFGARGGQSRGGSPPGRPGGGAHQGGGPRGGAGGGGHGGGHGGGLRNR